MVEAQLAADRRQLGRVRRIHQIGLLVEQPVDLVERRHSRLVGRVQLGELLDRVEEVVQRGDEREHDAGRRMAIDRLIPADQQDLDGDERRQELDRGEVRGVELDGRHVRRPVLVVELLEPSDVTRFLPERPHYADARQRLLEVARDRRDPLARQTVGVGGGDSERETAEGQDRQRQERQQRQVRGQHEQDHHHADQHQSRLDQRREPILDELVERLDVVGQAGDDHACSIARVEPQ